MYSEEKIREQWSLFRAKNYGDRPPSILANREFNIAFRHCGTIIQNIFDREDLRRTIPEPTNPKTNKPNRQTITKSILGTFKKAAADSKSTKNYLEILNAKRKEGLFNSLQNYKKKRESQPEYKNIFRFGFSKTDKVNAVDKAMNMISNSPFERLKENEHAALFEKEQWHASTSLYHKYIRPYGTLLETIITEKRGFEPVKPGLVSI